MYSVRFNGDTTTDDTRHVQLLLNCTVSSLHNSTCSTRRVPFSTTNYSWYSCGTKSTRRVPFKVTLSISRKSNNHKKPPYCTPITPSSPQSLLVTQFSSRDHRIFRIESSLFSVTTGDTFSLLILCFLPYVVYYESIQRELNIRLIIIV
jgi:hypothetical protein